MEKNSDKMGSGANGNLNLRLQMGCLEIDGKKFPLYEGLNQIGRSKDATVIIRDENVSQNHAIITIVDESQHFISDLNSFNGTFVEKDERKKLHPLLLYELVENTSIELASVTAKYKKVGSDSQSVSNHCSNGYGIDTQNVNESFYTAQTQAFETNFVSKPSANASIDTMCFEDNYDFSDVPSPPVVQIHKSSTSKEVSIHDAATQIMCLDTSANDSQNQSTTKVDIHELPTQIMCYDIAANECVVTSSSIHDLATQVIDRKQLQKPNKSVMDASADVIDASVLNESGLHNSEKSSKSATDSQSQLLVRRRAVKPIVDDSQDDDIVVSETKKKLRIIESDESGSETDVEDLEEAVKLANSSMTTTCTQDFGAGVEPEDKISTMPPAEVQQENESDTDSDDFGFEVKNTSREELDETDIIPSTQPLRPNKTVEVDEDVDGSEESFRLGITELMKSEEEKQTTEEIPVDNNQNEDDDDETPDISDVDEPDDAPVKKSDVTDDDILNQATQKVAVSTEVVNLLDVETQILTEDEMIFRKPIFNKNLGSAKKKSASQAMTSQDDDDIFLQATQKIASEDAGGSNRQLNTDADDDIFMQPTQKYEPSNQDATDDDDIFMQATQPVAMSQSAGPSVDIFMEPTQLITPCEPTTSGNPDDDIFMQETQPIVASKTVQDEVDDKIFMEPTQLITDCDDIFMQPTQPIITAPATKDADDIFDQPTQLIVVSEANPTPIKHSLSLKQKPRERTKFEEVESQLEVIFASQTLRLSSQASSRPSNPLLNVLDEEDVAGNGSDGSVESSTSTKEYCARSTLPIDEMDDFRIDRGGTDLSKSKESTVATTSKKRGRPPKKVQEVEKPGPSTSENEEKSRMKKQAKSSSSESLKPTRSSRRINVMEEGDEENASEDKKKPIKSARSTRKHEEDAESENEDLKMKDTEKQLSRASSNSSKSVEDDDEVGKEATNIDDTKKQKSGARGNMKSVRSTRKRNVVDGEDEKNGDQHVKIEDSKKEMESPSTDSLKPGTSTEKSKVVDEEDEVKMADTKKQMKIDSNDNSKSARSIRKRNIAVEENEESGHDVIKSIDKSKSVRSTRKSNMVDIKDDDDVKIVDTKKQMASGASDNLKSVRSTRKRNVVDEEDEKKNNQHVQIEDSKKQKKSASCDRSKPDTSVQKPKVVDEEGDQRGNRDLKIKDTKKQMMSVSTDSLKSDTSTQKPKVVDEEDNDVTIVDMKKQMKSDSSDNSKPARSTRKRNILDKEDDEIGSDDVKIADTKKQIKSVIGSKSARYTRKSKVIDEEIEDLKIDVARKQMKSFTLKSKEIDEEGGENEDIKIDDAKKQVKSTLSDGSNLTRTARKSKIVDEQDDESGSDDVKIKDTNKQMDSSSSDNLKLGKTIRKRHIVDEEAGNKHLKVADKKKQMSSASSDSLESTRIDEKDDVQIVDEKTQVTRGRRRITAVVEIDDKKEAIIKPSRNTRKSSIASEEKPTTSRTGNKKRKTLDETQKTNDASSDDDAKPVQKRNAGAKASSTPIIGSKRRGGKISEDRDEIPETPKAKRTKGSDVKTSSDDSDRSFLTPGRNRSAVLSTPDRNRRVLKPKVVFTMLDSPQLEGIIRRLGGSIVDSVESCTVLVTGVLKRSQKLLAAVGQGKPICSPNWIQECKKANKFVDPWEFLLKDEEAETKWNFSLEESLNRSQNSKLLEGFTILLAVTNALDVLKAAIESCGGKCVAKAPPKNIETNLIVVANPENKAKYSKFLKQKPPVTVVVPEAIFDGVLRQEFQWDDHKLS